MKIINLILCTALAAALLTQPQQVAAGAASGWSLCIDLLLPSLFPFMALASFFARTGAGELITRPLLPLTRRLGLADCTPSVLISSFIGGYPSGTQAILSYLDAGQLDRRSASRLLCCSVNAGPAFVVIAVGERMFFSRTLGWRLLAAQILASLLLCLLFCRSDSLPKTPARRQGEPFCSALVESVAQAARGFAAIGSYVVLISVLLELLLPLPLSPLPRTLLTGLLEVTTGCAVAASLGGKAGALLAAFFLSFGGCCVGFQILALLHRSGVPTRGFFFSRILSGLLGTLLLLPMLPALSAPVHRPVLLLLTAELFPAANSPNRLLGAACIIAMSAFLFARIDRCTNRMRRKPG